MRTDVPHNMYFEEEELNKKKQPKKQTKKLPVSVFVAPPASTLDNRRLALDLGPSGVYMCEACVSHWSSSDPRALM